jgi:hypothetical protein
VSCFCPPQLGALTEVTVVGDAVVSAKPLTTVFGADEELPAGAWPTVPKLFEILKTAREGGHIKDISASFDPQFGFPTTINITCKPDLLDCGVYYQAQNLKPLP